MRNLKNKVIKMINKKYQTHGLKKTKSGNHYLPTDNFKKERDKMREDAYETIRRDKMDWAGKMNKDMRKAAKKIEKKTKKGGRRKKHVRKEEHVEKSVNLRVERGVGKRKEEPGVNQGVKQERQEEKRVLREDVKLFIKPI